MPSQCEIRHIDPAFDSTQQGTEHDHDNLTERRMEFGTWSADTGFSTPQQGRGLGSKPCTMHGYVVQPKNPAGSFMRRGDSSAHTRNGINYRGYKGFAECAMGVLCSFSACTRSTHPQPLGTNSWLKGPVTLKRRFPEAIFLRNHKDLPHAFFNAILARQDHDCVQVLGKKKPTMIAMVGFLRTVLAYSRFACLARISSSGMPFSWMI